MVLLYNSDALLYLLCWISIQIQVIPNKYSENAFVVRPFSDHLDILIAKRVLKTPNNTILYTEAFVELVLQ